VDFLYGVTAHDGWTLVGAAALLSASGLVAAYLPARRAAYVNPAESPSGRMKEGISFLVLVAASSCFEPLTNRLHTGRKGSARDQIGLFLLLRLKGPIEENASDGRQPARKAYSLRVSGTDQNIPDYGPVAHCGVFKCCSVRSSQELFKGEFPRWYDLSMDIARQLLYGLPARRHGMLRPRTTPGEIVVARGFWIGRTEVTQAAYMRLIHADPSYYKGADLPVDRVGWTDATTYCSRIGMRLPTESEWEYAAYGGTGEVPKEPLASLAWYDATATTVRTPWLQKLPNGSGLWTCWEMSGSGFRTPVRSPESTS